VEWTVAFPVVKKRLGSTTTLFMAVAALSPFSCAAARLYLRNHDGASYGPKRTLVASRTEPFDGFQRTVKHIAVDLSRFQRRRKDVPVVVRTLEAG